MRLQPSRPFVPAKGLGSPHLQTLLAAGFRQPRLESKFRRVRWDTADGDFVDVDLLEASKPKAPVLLLMHGLEGSSGSGYIVETARLAALLGWSVAALNFRGCSGEPNRFAKTYCSGNYDDALRVAKKLRETLKPGALFAMGFSLGGNQLLVMLAEAGGEAGIDAAVACCVPYDLQQCVRLIDGARGVGSIYRRVFVTSMREKALARAKKFGAPLDAKKISRITTIEEIDEHVTAPLFGYRSAAHYYAECSSGPKVPKLQTPTLLLDAADDPLAPPSLLLPFSNPHVTQWTSARGGHVGFLERALPRPKFWAEEQAVAWLASL